MKTLTSLVFLGAALLAALPAMAQSSNETYCPGLQYMVGQPTPEGSVLAFPPVGQTRYLCGRQFLLSPAGFFGAIVDLNNGALLITRGQDRESVMWSGYGTGAGREFTVYFLALERPSKGELQLRIFAKGSGSNYEAEPRWSSGPISVQRDEPAFLRLTDDGALELREGTPAKVGKQLWGVQASDPVVAFDLQGFDYQTDRFQLSKHEQITGASNKCTNRTGTQTTCNLKLGLSYTKSQSFAFAFKQGLKVSQKFMGGVQIPFLAEAKSESLVELAFETQQTWTDTETKQESYELMLSVPTPAHTTYRSYIVATKVLGILPYTVSGLATYKSGKKLVIAKSPGTWAGSNAYEFDAVTECVSSPTNCEGAAPMRTPLEVAPQAALHGTPHGASHAAPNHSYLRPRS
jgi:hypothetical protein